MSFSAVRTITSSRFSEVQVYLNFITAEEPDNPTDTTSVQVKIIRGLFYVHLYAAIENSINELVQKSLLLINSKQVKNNHYTLRFNTISVLDKLHSLRDCSNKNFTNRSVALMQEIGSRNVRELNETAFSNQLQNIWMSTVLEVYDAFGIRNPIFEPRVRATIDEIVDKRNAVAHGRESAQTIGERHRSDVLRQKLNIAQTFIIQVIDDFENFYDDKKFLKPVMKKHY